MNKRLIYAFIFTLLSLSCAYSSEQDFIVDMFLKDKELEKPFINTVYNYQSTYFIPIKLSPIEPIRSEKNVQEGQTIKLKVKENVIIKQSLIVPKGTICTARVETIIANGMNGIPASIILGNFKIPNIDTKLLQGEYEKFGFDLSLLVYPIKWVLTPLPPTGSLTNFIKGGHAKIDKNDVIILRYYPDFN